MSIFLVAFKYKKKRNISEVIARSLPYDSFILGSEDDIPALMQEIRKKKPRFVLGLGQSKRGKLIRIESKARNLLIKKGKVICHGRQILYATLKLKTIKNTRISYNAGTYLCNYVYYSLLSSFPKNPGICFLHIPKTLSVSQGRTTVRKLITTIFK